MNENEAAMEWTTEDEALAAEVHRVYCRAYEKRFDKPYWTNGDFSKLDKPTADYDRAFVAWHKLYSGKIRADHDEALRQLAEEKDAAAQARMDRESAWSATAQARRETADLEHRLAEAEANLNQTEQDARSMFAVFKKIRDAVENGCDNITIKQMIAIFTPLRWEWLDPLVKAEAETAALKAKHEETRSLYHKAAARHNAAIVAIDEAHSQCAALSKMSEPVRPSGQGELCGLLDAMESRAIKALAILEAALERNKALAADAEPEVKP